MLFLSKRNRCLEKTAQVYRVCSVFRLLKQYSLLFVPAFPFYVLHPFHLRWRIFPKRFTARYQLQNVHDWYPSVKNLRKDNI